MFTPKIKKNLQLLVTNIAEQPGNAAGTVSETEPNHFTVEYGGTSESLASVILLVEYLRKGNLVIGVVADMERLTPEAVNGRVFPVGENVEIATNGIGHYVLTVQFMRPPREVVQWLTVAAKSAKDVLK